MRDLNIKLISTRRFAPLFLTQFLEAFNDNFFKITATLFIVYVLNVHDEEIMATIGAGIFILPFFIFSAMAGQLADKFNKALLTRLIKLIEVLAMTFAAVGFLQGSVTLLLFTLFLMGTHSAFFGPIKYSILPDLLVEEELITGTALVESSTFIAILLGTILGSLLIPNRMHILSQMTGDIITISSIAIGIALTGLTSSFFIPRIKRHQPDLKIDFNFVRATFRLIHEAQAHKKVFLCILGISWFWLTGTIFLTQMPAYFKNTLHAGPHVLSLGLAFFSIGIAIGSILSERLQKNKIHAHFVPVTMLAMSVFIIDLYIASPTLTDTTQPLLNVPLYLSSFNHWHILFDMLMLAICGGLFIVPLYTMLQVLSPSKQRSRMVATNNIVNALFMVVASIGTVFLLAINLSIPNVFLVLGIINIGVAIYFAKLLPEAIVKSVIAWVLKFIYRVQVVGLENYHKAKSNRIIVANHVSFLDALLLAAFLPERILFAINPQTARKWWLKPLLSLVDTYPIELNNLMAVKTLAKAAVEQNRPCMLFPEGRITVTGALMKIYLGPALIADKANADIIPIRIDGAQYTPFSRLRGKVNIRWFPNITINILPPKRFDLEDSLKGEARHKLLRTQFYDLMTDLMFRSRNHRELLFVSLIKARNLHGRYYPILEDIQRQKTSYQQLLVKSIVLGRYLRKMTQPKQAVGLFLPNSIANVVCFFALQIYQRIPAMLNFSIGAKILLSTCETAAVKLVLTSRRFIEMGELEESIQVLSDSGIHIIYLEDLRDKITLSNKLIGALYAIYPSAYARAKQRHIKPEDPAIILFTSGSEGLPKGVVLSHINVQTNRLQLTACVDFNNEDKFFNTLPMFHSFGLTAGTLLPILSGIKTFLYPSPLHYKAIPELIYDTNATIMFGTNTFLTGYARTAHPYDFYSMRYIFAGAEPLKTETRTLWAEKFGVRVFEGYGVTETAPVLSVNTPQFNKPGTVGRLLPAIDHKLTPVEGIEEGGRLSVRGPNVMMGYLLPSQPGKLIPLKEDWHDTGDIVSIDSEGFITIKGRAKRFAKIGGEMVSLADIEQYATQCSPEHLHAATQISDPKKGEQVILLTEDPELTREKLIKHYKQQGIGEIYLPRRIMPTSQMPVLGSGKIDYVEVKKIVAT